MPCHRHSGVNARCPTRIMYQLTVQTGRSTSSCLPHRWPSRCFALLPDTAALPVNRPLGPRNDVVRPLSRPVRENRLFRSRKGTLLIDRVAGPATRAPDRSRLDADRVTFPAGHLRRVQQPRHRVCSQLAARVRSRWAKPGAVCARAWNTPTRGRTRRWSRDRSSAAGSSRWGPVTCGRTATPCASGFLACSTSWPSRRRRTAMDCLPGGRPRRPRARRDAATWDSGSTASTNPTHSSGGKMTASLVWPFVSPGTSHQKLRIY